VKAAALAGTPSLTEGVYRALRDDLLACRIRPGEKLKIAELALHYGVNAGAVRESLARLSSEGFAVLEAQRGFRAAPVSLSDLRDLTRTRIEIEMLCLTSALARGDVDWEARLIAAFHRLEHTPEFETDADGEDLNAAWMQVHAAFHEALVEACDSVWLLRIRAQLYAQSERYRRLSVPLRLARDRNAYLATQSRDHRALMDAALARDTARLGGLVSEHFGRTADLVQVLAEDMSMTGDERTFVGRG
jgi:DNA-binding GntR family transcriptional regulator